MSTASLWSRARDRFLGRWRGGSLGARGERAASKWLRNRGYRLLERNRALGRDEADLVMLAPDGLTIVVVEVKSRRSDDTPPESNITKTKRRHLSRIGARLLQDKRYADRPIRFDVVTVVWPERERPVIRHFEHAFESEI